MAEDWEVKAAAGGAVWFYLLLYVVARKLDLIPQLLAPYMDAVTGVLVLAVIPFLPWTITALPFAPFFMLGLIADFIAGRIGRPETGSPAESGEEGGANSGARRKGGAG